MTNFAWESVKDLELDELAERASVYSNNMQIGPAVRAAFDRLQTIAMQEASKAQIDAAQATKDTAEFTRQSAYWMKVSAIVLAVASVANLVVTIWKH